MPFQPRWVHSSWSEVVTGLVSCSLEKSETRHHAWDWSSCPSSLASSDSLTTLLPSLLSPPLPVLSSSAGGKRLLGVKVLGTSLFLNFGKSE